MKIAHFTRLRGDPCNSWAVIRSATSEDMIYVDFLLWDGVRPDLVRNQSPNGWYIDTDAPVDSWTVPDPTDWPDEICAYVAKHTLMGVEE